MALSSAFHERLEQMEHTRNQRLSLLQAEKSLQETKYQVFASKLTNIRSMEQRCLALDQKIASQNFKTSVLNSEIESLDAKYLECSHKLRGLKSELEDLEELGKEKERFYELKGLEMKDFREKVERFVAGCRARVNELRNHVDELRSTFKELHGNSGYFDHWEIAAAEKRKSELLAMKESLNKNLASNYQLRAQYEKQLQNILTAHNEDRRREG